MTNEDEIQIIEKQLDRVRNEIERIENDGEEAEFETNGSRRKVRRADISRLYEREYELLSRHRRISGQSVSYSVAGD